MDEKTCVECSTAKPVTEFYRNKGHKDGLSSRCRMCTGLDMHRRWRAKHPEPPPPDGLKNCPHCNTRKSKDEFYKNRSTHDGLQGICKQCQVTSIVARHKAEKEKHSAYQLEWGRKNPDKKADIALKVRLGIPHGTYARMFAEQGGRCAICGTDKAGGNARRLAVDHDAKTGQVRGLLCTSCNNGLGRFHDDPNLLVAAAGYLQLTRKFQY